MSKGLHGLRLHRPWLHVLWLAAGVACLGDPRALAEEERDASSPSAPASSEEVERAAALVEEGYRLVGEQQFDAAIAKEREAVAIFRRVLGEAEETAVALNELAYVLNEAGRHDEALPAQVEALAMMRRLQPGDHPRVAGLLGNLASCYIFLGRNGDALPIQRESLDMRRRLNPGDDAGVATSLDKLSHVYSDLGREAEALPLQEEALAMRRRVFPGDHPDVSLSLSNLAAILTGLGRPGDGRPHAEEALAMTRRLHSGDHPDVVRSLLGLADIHESLGRPGDGLPLVEEACAMTRRMFPPDHPETAVAVDRLGHAYREVGRPADALALRQEALGIHRRVFRGDHPTLATSLDNLASTYSRLARHEEALPLRVEALAMYRRLFPGGHPDVAIGLANLASTYRALGMPEEALPLSEEALAMSRGLFPGDHPDTASHLGNLAATHHDLGRSAEALARAEEALAMDQRLYAGDHPVVVADLDRVAHSLLTLGRADRAEAYLRQAVDMARRVRPAELHMPLVRLARELLARKEYEEAVVLLREAMASLETRRQEAKSLPSLDRATYLTSIRYGWDPYPPLVEALVRLGRTADALGTLERSHGREMLDLLESGQVDPLARAEHRARSAGDARRVEEIARSREEVAAAEAAASSREREERAARRRGVPKEVREAALSSAQARRDVLESMTRQRRLVADLLPEASPISPERVQALLAPDERLLCYGLGDDRVHSFAFLVSSSAVRVFRLEDEGGAVLRSALTRRVADYVGDLIAKTPASASGAGLALFQVLVPGAAWEELRGASRVYLVPHGPLHALPFEALVVGEAESGPRYWLDDGPAVAYVPSASVLSWLRSREPTSGKELSLVAVGDPVFAGDALTVPWPSAGVLLTGVRPDGEGQRLGLRPGDTVVRYDDKAVADPASLQAAMRSAGTERTEVAVEIRRGGQTKRVRARPGLLGVTIAMEPPDVAGPALVSRGPMAVAVQSSVDRGRSLAPLPGTRVEVEAITRTVRDRFGERARVTTLLGNEATEENLHAAAHGPRFLHLATHGLVDETETASFSSVALTLPALPVPGDDGFLTLVDLFQRWQGRLEGTELVVLSACESTRGRLQRDEAMYALPWGFLFAGARAVVGSLWKVDDDATAVLMADFYRRLLEGDGKDALGALTAARRTTKAKYPLPRDWASFVFTGATR